MTADSSPVGDGPRGFIQLGRSEFEDLAASLTADEAYLLLRLAILVRYDTAERSIGVMELAERIGFTWRRCRTSLDGLCAKGLIEVDGGDRIRLLAYLAIVRLRPTQLDKVHNHLSAIAKSRSVPAETADGTVETADEAVETASSRVGIANPRSEADVIEHQPPDRGRDIAIGSRISPRERSRNRDSELDPPSALREARPPFFRERDPRARSEVATEVCDLGDLAPDERQRYIEWAPDEAEPVACGDVGQRPCPDCLLDAPGETRWVEYVSLIASGHDNWVSNEPPEVAGWT